MPITPDLHSGFSAVALSRSLGIEPDPWQAAVLRSRSRRIILNCARQTGKSTTAATVALHQALYTGDSLILLVSPSQRQSTELFRKVTGLLDRLPVRPALVEDNRLSCVLPNRSRIVSLPSSEATVRGFSGAALIIEDEAARVPDDLYRAIRPMLATSGGKLILMSTPFGKRGHFSDVWHGATPGLAGSADVPQSILSGVSAPTIPQSILSGVSAANAVEGCAAPSETWTRITVPAAHCPRITPQFLAEEQATLGAWWYAQEYDCQFLDAVSSAFTWNMINAALQERVEVWNL